MAKIVSFRKAVKLAEELRKKGKKIVYTSGCFDILHIGHITFINKAKKAGGVDAVLFVGVENDDYIKRMKGKHRPVFDQRTRATMLSKLIDIDFVIPFKHKYSKPETYFKYRKMMGEHLYVCGRTDKKIIERILGECKSLGIKAKLINHDYKISTTKIEKVLYKHFAT